MNLEQKISQIDKELAGALSSKAVELVAVTKYASDEQVLEAYNLGLRIFGENYVLPALEKMQRLKDYFIDGAPQWHLLGKLQSNKVKKAVGNFDCIQSVHSLGLAEAINDQAQELGIKQKIFLQLNMTGDKNGFEPKSSLGTLIKTFQLANLEVIGLMTMGFFANTEEISEKNETIYDEMRQFKSVLESELDSLGICRDLKLSMGMSNDYRTAVKNGSTMIRLGRELFGSEF